MQKKKKEKKEFEETFLDQNYTVCSPLSVTLASLRSSRSYENEEKGKE